MRIKVRVCTKSFICMYTTYSDNKPESDNQYELMLWYVLSPDANMKHDLDIQCD